MSQRYSFNLIDEPWLPCVMLDGRAEELSLRQTLFEADQIRELCGDSPLVQVALHRLLLAVLHRVFGPAGYNAWAELWQAGHWNAAALDSYFGRWHERFDLFHQGRPFYQAADPRVKPKSVISLIHELASGNNPVFFDHHVEDKGESLTPAVAARTLLTSQSFGISGTCDPSQKLNFSDGPCTRGIHFLLEGKNLFETILLNMTAYPDEEVMTTTSGDRPVWEMDDPFHPPRAFPLGYLDYLTWQNRRILLLPEEGDDGPVVRRMIWAPALRLDASVLDPFKHYRIDKDAKAGESPYKLLRFHEERALWRDSAALFSLHQDPGENRARPPRTFRWLHELRSEAGVRLGQRLYHYRALGMSSDQARVFFYRDERLPLPLAYLDRPELVTSLQEATGKAEDAARQLWGACRTLATFLLKPNADAEGIKAPAREDLDKFMSNWASERPYWAALEVPFHALLLALPDDPTRALTVWHADVRRIAGQALEQTIDLAGEDGRALKAAVRARQQLAAGLSKIYSFLIQEVIV